jgi:hypothetical protein
MFEAEALVLKTWMTTAGMKLEDLKTLTPEDMANIGNIRTKVEHILVSNQLFTTGHLHMLNKKSQCKSKM